MLCHKIIPIVVDEHGRMVSNTYCMKPADHEGKCEEVQTDPEVKLDAPIPQTPSA